MLRDRRRAQRILLAMGLMALMTSLIMVLLLRDWIQFVASNLTG